MEYFKVPYIYWIEFSIRVFGVPAQHWFHKLVIKLEWIVDLGRVLSVHIRKW